MSDPSTASERIFHDQIEIFEVVMNTDANDQGNDIIAFAKNPDGTQDSFHERYIKKSGAIDGSMEGIRGISINTGDPDENINIDCDPAEKKAYMTEDGKIIEEVTTLIFSKHSEWKV